MDEVDTFALYNPTLHGLHCGARDAEPGTAVKLPVPHLVWGVHTSFASAVLFLGAFARKNPLAQGVHSVSLVGVPAASVHSPREQVLWTPEHASASDASCELSTGGTSLYLPLLQVKHWVSVVEVPACAVH